MITKELILKSTSEFEIIKKYVPDFKELSHNCKSPFTDADDKPSFSVYEQRGKLKYKSHNTGHQGDVFQLVADLKKLDAKNQFMEVLEAINTDLNLGLSAQKEENNNEITFQPFTENFLAYFNQFGINQATLLKYNVKQVSRHKFTSKALKKLDFDYVKMNQIVACYTINSRIKIYIPKIEHTFNNDLNFRGQEKAFGYKNQSSKDIFGLAQLPQPPIEYIIFSAGEKDCLALNAHGFTAISLQSENQLPQADLIKKLKESAKILLCCYDNDDAGKLNSKKLFDTFGISSIILPENIKDVADYFLNHKTKDFQHLVEKAILSHKNRSEERKKNQNGSTLFHQAENYLLSKYNFRFNEIKHVYEIAKIDSFEYSEMNENSLYVELNKAGIKIGLNQLLALIKSDLCGKYNPILYYFENLKSWSENEEDYISKLASYVDAEEQEEFNSHLKKWLVRSVKCVLENGYYNKHALILVHAKQNSGKSSFCRFLCPPSLQDYISENIEPNNKDSLIALAQNFIINLDELKQFSNSDINTLKAWISQDRVNVRLPYEKRACTINRIVNFVGSTNEGEFLKDATGSVRWLCFKINSINHDYNNYLTQKREVDIDDIWSQAFSLYKSGFRCDLSAQEIDKNEERNNQFKQLSPEMELLPQYFVSSDESHGEFLSSTEISSWIQARTTIKINPIMIGKALQYHNFPRIKNSKQQRYGYWIEKLTQ